MLGPTCTWVLAEPLSRLMPARLPPCREEQLITFLKQLEQDQERLGVTDVQLSLTSLEEVFLTIARKVGGKGAVRGHGACWGAGARLRAPWLGGSAQHVLFAQTSVTQLRAGCGYHRQCLSVRCCC